MAETVSVRQWFRLNRRALYDAHDDRFGRLDALAALVVSPETSFLQAVPMQITRTTDGLSYWDVQALLVAKLSVFDTVLRDLAYNYGVELSPSVALVRLRERVLTGITE